jgi:hypothetical protein
MSCVQEPPEHAAMTDERRETVVTDLLHWPCAGVIPDAATDSLCVWLLKRRGILKESHDDPA